MPAAVGAVSARVGGVGSRWGCGGGASSPEEMGSNPACAAQPYRSRGEHQSDHSVARHGAAPALVDSWRRRLTSIKHCRPTDRAALIR